MTSLITVDNPEIYAISVAQSPGLIAPAINASIMPDAALPESSWLQYEPPPLVISIGGVTYNCLPQEVSVEIDPDTVGVSIEVQYYPDILIRLQNTGLKKHLVFLSCSGYEYEILEGEYNGNTHEVLYKPCDTYISNGWTVNGIIAEIGDRAGVTIESLLPPFHVPNPTVVFKRGQKFLPFVRSLLPGDFEYVWSITNDKLTIALIQSGDGNTDEIGFIEGMHRIICSTSGVPAYDLVEISGGYYKWGTGVIDLGGDISLGGGASYPNGKRVSESLPPEEKETADGTETHYIARIYKTGPEGTNLFALLERTTRVDGDYNGATATIRETEETFSYENSSPLIYLQPRHTLISTDTKKFFTRIVLGLSGGMNIIYYLTDDARVLSKAEYDAIPVVDQPTVLMTAYHVYGTAKTQEETFSWITEENADKIWFEGTQRDNTIAITQLYDIVDGVYYDAFLSPKELLQQVLTDVVTREETVTITSIISEAWKTAELVTKKIKLVSEGAFQAEQQSSLFDTKVGNLIPHVSTQTINGLPPGNPTKYRTERLIASMGGDSPAGAAFRASGNLCIPFMAEINTNNVSDFELWAGLLWEQKSTQARRVSMASFDRLLPMGSIINGVTMTSFQCSQSEDGTQVVIMGGV